MALPFNQDEQALILAIRRLDQQALAAVFDAFYDPIFGYIARRVYQKQVAEDLTSEVFRKLLEQIGAGKGPDRYLKAYLYRIAQNLVVDYSRRQKHRDHDELDEFMDDGSESIAAQVEDRIRFQQAHKALSALDERQQAVISLRFIEGLTIEEVAHTLRMTIPTVKALQHRGLSALRNRLEVTGLGDGGER